jgi:hypothetical protein
MALPSTSFNARDPIGAGKLVDPKATPWDDGERHDGWRTMLLSVILYPSNPTFSRSTAGVPSAPNRNNWAQVGRSFASGLPIMVHPVAKA